MRWAEEGRGATLAVMALAGVTLYAASRTAAGVLAGYGDGRTGRRAVSHWIPVAAVAVVAAGLGHPDISVTLTFATSVASLAFVLGVLSYLAPMEHLPPTRRAWPFVLPAALLPLIAGFSGQFTWVHALAMSLLGGALLSTWRDPALREGDGDIGPFAESASTSQRRPALLVAAELTL